MPLHHKNPEQEYVSLMYETSNLYASWEPSRAVKAGDYGHLQHDHSFDVEGNIFDNGMAQEFGIHTTQSSSDEIRWIEAEKHGEKKATSEFQLSSKPLPVEGRGHFSVAMSSSQGAILMMREPRKFSLEPPGRLPHLLYSQDSDFWRKRVLVSEVFTCCSYARLYAPHEERTVEVSLDLEAGQHAHGRTEFKWRTTSEHGYFIAKDSHGSQPEDVACPLFKLVGRKHRFDILPGHRRPVTEVDHIAEPVQRHRPSPFTCRGHHEGATHGEYNDSTEKSVEMRSEFAHKETSSSRHHHHRRA